MSARPGKPPAQASSRAAAPKLRGRHKRGRRIVQLLRQQDTSEQQQLPQQQEWRIPHAPSPRPQSCASSPPAAQPSTSTAPTDSPRPTITHSFRRSRASLLAVPGLTRQALDDCISAFFSYIEPAYRLSEPRDQFVSRVRVLMYHVAGADIPNDLANVEAASELLTLAAACLGAPHSAHPGMSQPLYDRCRVLALQPGFLDDASLALDNLEAVDLLASAVQGSNQERTRASHAFKLDPLANGFAVDLALFHKLNVPSAHGDTDPEHKRCQALFWSVWERDAIRTVSAGMPCSLADVDIGWAPPDNMSCDPHLRLAQVARQISSAALSARAKVQGVHERDLLGAISALGSYDLSVLLGAAQQSTSPKQLYLQSVRSMLCLVAWTAAKENNLALPVIASLEAASIHAAERMALSVQATTSLPLLNTVPRAVLDCLATFVLFLAHILRLSPQDLPDAARYHARAHAEALGRALREATIYHDCERIADALSDVVLKASRDKACCDTNPVQLRQRSTPRGFSGYDPNGSAARLNMAGLSVPRFLLSHDELPPLPPG